MRLRCLLVMTFAVVPGLLPVPDVFGRDLTFDDRVDAQDAIARVYY